MKTNRPYWLNLFALLTALLLSVAVGAVTIPLPAQWQILASRLLGLPAGAGLPATYETILFSLRLPHTLLVAVCGAALAGSGAAYQGLFRNPLADPYLIGAASGAGLGAVAAMAVLRTDTLGSMFSVPAAAFLGALALVGVVYWLAYTGPSSAPTTTLILAGIAAGSFASALTSFLMLRSQGELRRAVAWLMGGADASGWQPLWAVLPYIAAGLGVLVTSGHALNVLQFGEEQALQLGLPVRRVKGLLVLAATLSTAAAVSFSGIIGFVGLIVPHVVRLLWGADYRRLLPLSILGGATALLLADVLARVIMAPQELPVGIITALAGGPFFLWVLRRSQRALGQD